MTIRKKNNDFLNVLKSIDQVHLVLVLLTVCGLAKALMVVSPLADAWIPYPLNIPGQIPYQDFYYPTLPGLIWLAEIIENLSSQPLLVWHIVGGLTPLAVGASTYLCIDDNVSRSAKSLGVLTAGIVFLGFSIETVGGWNHLSIAALFLSIGLYCKSIRLKRQITVFLIAVTAGVIFALSTLIKHTVLGVFPFLLVALFMKPRDSQRSTGRLTVVSGFLTGASVSWSIAAVVTLQGGYFRDLITALTGSSGKEVRISTFLPTFFTSYSTIIIQNATFVGFIVALVLINQLTKDDGPVHEDVCRVTMWLNVLASVWLSMVFLIAAEVVVIQAILLVLLTLRYQPTPSNVKGLFCVCVLVPATLLIVQFPEKSLNTILGIFALSDSVLIVLSVVFLFGLVFHTIKKADESRAFIVFGIVGLLLTVHVSGAAVPANVSLVLGVGIAQVANSIIERHDRVIRVVSLVLVVFLLLGRATAVVERPFAWWGWTEPELSLRRQQSDEPYLRGFFLSPRSKTFYDQLGSLLDEAARRYPNGTVFSFPVIPIAVNLSDFTPTNVRCPVVFWDLCPEELATKTFSQIRSTRPDVLVWATPSQETQQSHEAEYRGGRPSVLREMATWYELQKKSGSYVLLGTVLTVGSEPNTQWPIEVAIRTAP